MYGTYFRGQISVDKVLIALEFNRTVTTDCLVMIARNGAVESVHAQIEHTIVRISILKDDFIHRTRFIMGAEVLRGHEVILVEVALADTDEIQPNEDHHGHGNDGHPSLPDKRSVLSHSIHLRSAESP